MQISKLLILMAFFFSTQVGAQSIYDATTSPDSTSTASNQGVQTSDFKSKVTALAQKISDDLTQELQQQLVTYRLQHPVGPPEGNGSLYNTTNPPTTPPPSGLPPSVRSAMPPASAPSSFSVTQPPPRSETLPAGNISPAPKSNQWDVRY